jgi:CheY-like chemotaxis protein
MPDATAFLSYTRKDDAFFSNYISNFRESLEIGVHVATGNDSFRIFQDVDGIVIGEQWEKKIAEVIDASCLFIPILSPLFLNSTPCRDEVELFIHHERKLGRDDLILPVYLISAPKLEKPEETKKDPIAREIARRQRFDWREKSKLSLHEPSAREAILDLARQIGDAIDRIEAPSNASPGSRGAGVDGIDTPRSAKLRSHGVRHGPSPEANEAHREKLGARAVADMGRDEPSERTILWVDDVPSNNIWERRALESYGMRFVLARTTDEAVEQLRSRSFDAVISDMSRPGDRRAGFTLLEEVRAAASAPPYFIYCGRQAPFIAAEGRRRGADLVTNDPDDLVAAVVAAVR